jgi:hypothetical protein
MLAGTGQFALNVISAVTIGVPVIAKVAEMAGAIELSGDFTANALKFGAAGLTAIAGNVLLSRFKNKKGEQYIKQCNEIGKTAGEMCKNGTPINMNLLSGKQHIMLEDKLRNEVIQRQNIKCL